MVELHNHHATQHKYTVNDVVIRSAKLYHPLNTDNECKQIHQLINYSFRGRPIDNNNKQTTIYSTFNENNIFKTYSQRIDINEINSLQNNRYCTILLAIIPYTSKKYNNNSENILVDDGILVGCIRVEILINDSNTNNDKRNLYRTSNNDSFELGLFSIDPLYSGYGIGSILFHYGEQYGIKQYSCNVSLVWLISHRPQLMKLYEKYGYVMVNKRASEFKPDSNDLLDPQQSMYFLVMKREFVCNILGSVQLNDNTSLIIRHAQLTDLKQLTTLINWSFRGKPNVDTWTDEVDMFNGDRTNIHGLTQTIQQSMLQPNDVLIVVGIKQYNQPISDVELNDTSKLFLSPTKQLICSTTQYRQFDELCIHCKQLNHTTCTHTMLQSMTAVDPSMTSNGYYKHIMSIVEQYCIDVWNVNTTYVHVIEQRTEWVNVLINKCKFKDTGKRMKFDVPEQNQYITPKWQDKLSFVVLEKPLISTHQ